MAWKTSKSCCMVVVLSINNILFQITEALPKTFSGKKVREPLKGIAQNSSMQGKLWQEICTTDIKKYCCPDLLRVHLI